MEATSKKTRPTLAMACGCHPTLLSIKKLIKIYFILSFDKYLKKTGQEWDYLGHRYM
jgi:hypothetical protein